MKFEVVKYPLGRKIYRKKFFSNNLKFSLYCFGCGIVIALILVIAIY